jgi:hypothetical protein
VGYVTSIGRPELLDNGIAPAIGALTPLFAATNPIIWEEKDKYGGAYLTPYGSISEPSENARNTALAKSLWDLSDKFANMIIL